jgi:hypothetical protein
MLEDNYLWRCLCGNQTNPLKNVKCLKCGKQRWAQLGFSIQDAFDLIDRLTPEYLKEKFRKKIKQEA